jgi:RNA polymerase sigma-70 factor (ECF subfamily)
MRLRKRRTGKMVSIDEDVETEEGSVPRDLADWAPDPEQNYSQGDTQATLLTSGPARYYTVRINLRY